jgi:hypothetical protein
MILEDGKAIFDSRVITRFLDELGWIKPLSLKKEFMIF